MRQSIHNLRRIFIIFGVFLTLSLPLSLQADDSEWIDTEQLSLRLISSSSTLGNEGQAQLGLQFMLNTGWKVYWRSPGDAGFPPSIDWQGSTNLTSSEILWPVPKRFSVLGLETLGYKNEVLFPIQVSVNDALVPLKLRGVVNFLACNEICIPYDLQLSLDLAPGSIELTSHAHLINKWVSIIPGDGTASGLSVQKIESYSRNEQGYLQITAAATAPFTDLDVFTEGGSDLTFLAPVIHFDDNKRQATIEVPVLGNKGYLKELADKSYTVTLVDKQRTAEISAIAVGTQAPLPLIQSAGPSQEQSILTILAIALLGGIILNLMPCVLPVLSIKLLSLVGHGGDKASHVRAGFLATTAGIIVSFWVIAGVLVTLKLGGAAIGWGIQFQQPWFLVIMTLLVAVFACNLWGFFEFQTPQWLPQSAGPAGLRQNFLQGAFATLLATPCSAPFLGTAVGFALSRGPFEIFLVFTVLGIGLSLPYILIALFPGLATWMPRPGLWMLRLKQVLGFALLATAIWLLSILAVNIGLRATATLALTIILIGSILYFHKRISPAVWILAATTIVVSLFIQPEDKIETENHKIWQAFEPEKIPELVAGGKTVFIDVTAEWCVTCLINKKLVIYQGAMINRLSQKNIVAMQADWTRPDPIIAAYLASHGRYGIPFNAVYGPNSPTAILLPEILTTQTVLDALDAAK